MIKNRMTSENYDPIGLIDFLVDELNLKNDAALCRYLGVNPPIISKIRTQVLPITGDTLIRMQDLTGIPIDTLREVAGIPKYTESNKKYEKPSENKEAVCSAG